MPNTSPTDRISRLEAFRGLGAIAVIVTHCFLVVPWDGQGAQLLLIKLVCLFLNGHTALMIFFVISGYVLGLSLDKGASRPDNVSRFYVRRGFRIYPAHLVALGFIAIALSSFGHAVRPSAASQMFGAWFPATLSPITGLFNALLLRVDMNGVAWTLVLEVAISLVFPLLYWTSRRSPGWVRAAILVGLIGVSFAVGNRTTQASVAVITDYLKPLLGQFSYVPTILNSLALYGYVFYVGLTAEPAFKRLVPRIEGRWGTRLMWFALFVAVTSNVYTGGFTPTSLFIEVCGATFLVFYGILTHTRNLLIKALDHPFFKWLGAISYSFYLYHFIIVYCIATALFRVVDPMLIGRDPLLFGVDAVRVSGDRGTRDRVVSPGGSSLDLVLKESPHASEHGGRGRRAWTAPGGTHCLLSSIAGPLDRRSRGHRSGRTVPLSAEHACPCRGPCSRPPRGSCAGGSRRT